MMHFFPLDKVAIRVMRNDITLIEGQQMPFLHDVLEHHHHKVQPHFIRSMYVMRNPKDQSHSQ